VADNLAPIRPEPPLLKNDGKKKIENQKFKMKTKLHKKYLIAYPSDDVSAYSHLNLDFPQLSARLSILLLSVSYDS
jgi:hypothetical protein